MRDDHHGSPAKLGQPSHQRRIIAKFAVAVQLTKIREEALNKIQRVRATFMPRQLNALHGMGRRLSYRLYVHRVLFGRHDASPVVDY